MNSDLMKDTVKALRKEGVLRAKFDMSSFVNLCGTAGCLAGTMVLVAGLKIIKEDDAGQGFVCRESIELSGLPEPLRRHLFLPTYWQGDLRTNEFCHNHKHLWTHNSTPSMETVEDMKAFAATCNYDTNGYSSITSDHAATVLEALIDNPYYVDWRQGVDA